MKNPFLIQPSKWIKKFYSKAIWQGSRAEKFIYLTFDDGPVPELTEWILDELKSHNAKATFFCVGENIIKHPVVFERIKQEGHQIANHTYNHLKGFNATVEEYLLNTDKCEALTQSKLFRPPYGQLRKSQYRALLKKNYKIVFWDVISYDYEKISPENCFNILKQKVKNGSIVLFHDNLKAEKNVKFALTNTLNHFGKLGFVFKTL